MQREINRMRAFDQGLVFASDEMISWMQAEIGASEEMSEAVLGAWVGALRYDVLTRAESAERPQDFLQTVESGKGRIALSCNLIPTGWSQKELLSHISQETGVLHRDAHDLLQTIGQQFQRLSDKKAFEPLGWVQTQQGSDAGYSVNLWQDFLEFQSDEPPIEILVEAELMKEVVESPESEMELLQPDAATASLIVAPSMGKHLSTERQSRPRAATKKLAPPHSKTQRENSMIELVSS